MSGIKTLLDTLRAVAQEGLSYSQNEYDTARYEKLLALTSAEYSSLTDIPQEEIKALFLQEQGSITPKLGVDAVVVNKDGQLLMLQRNDGTWGMPGGWADVGESPYQTAARETKEETGLEVTALGYVGIAYKTPDTHPGFASQVNISVATKLNDEDQEVVLSHEHQAFKWISDMSEIDNWHAGQKRLVPVVLEAYRQAKFIPNID